MQLSDNLSVFSPTDLFAMDDFFTERPCVDEHSANKIAPLNIPDHSLIGVPARLMPVSSNQDSLESGFVHLLNSDFLFTPPTIGQPAPMFKSAPVEAHTQITLPKSESGAVKKSSPAKIKDVPSAPSKKKALQSDSQMPVDPSRAFQTVFCNSEIVGQGQVTVKIKTRRDQPSEAVPERMYASIKYEVVQYANNFLNDMQFILSRIRLVDAESFEPIKKNNKDVMKGTIEAALTKPPRNAVNQFEGKLQCQFADVSYHTDKREFRLEISYFAPNDLNSPILIKRSAPFKAYARKPNKKRPSKNESLVTSSSNKRKRPMDDNDEEDEDISLIQQSTSLAPPPVKKSKSELDVFASRLDDLLEFQKKLPDTEKKKALEMILSKFMSMDRNHTASALLQIMNIPHSQ